MMDPPLIIWVVMAQQGEFAEFLHVRRLASIWKASGRIQTDPP